MSVAEMVLEGLNLMVLGMGMVFMFLAVLVLTMRAMSRLARALENSVDTPASAAASVPAPQQQDDLVAVISAAVARYRSNNG